MSLRRILERREAIRAEMQSLHDGSNGGALSAEAETRWNALAAEAETLNAAERRESALADLARNAGNGQPIGEDRHFAEFRAGFGLTDLVRAQLPDFRNDRRSGQVIEASQEISRRSGRAPQHGGLVWDLRGAAETRTTTTGGQSTTNVVGALVPQQLRPDLFIDRLRNALICRRLGMQMITDLQGNVDVPRRSASVTAGFVQEGANVPTSDGNYDKVSFRARTLGGVSVLSRNAVIQASPELQALTESDFARVIAEAVDSAALVGTGSSYTPTGIVPGATAKTYAHGSSGPAWSDVLAALSALETANVQPSGWALAGGMRGVLMNTPKSATLSLGFIQEDPNTLAGLPALPSNLLPAGMLIAGAWDSAILATWAGGLELAANMWADSVYSSGSIAVRALLTCDIQVRHAASFVTLTQAAS